MRIMPKKEMITLVFIVIFGLAGAISAGAQEGKYALVPLGGLNGPNTYPYDINDSGQVVGQADTGAVQGSMVWKAFLWNKGCMGQTGCMQELFQNETYRSSANAINSGGIIAGYRNGSAFLFAGNGGATDLGTFPQDASSWALSINSANKVAGFGSNEGSWKRGVLWERGTDGLYSKNDLGNLGGAFTEAASLNDADQVVGSTSYAAGYARAFRWQKTADGTGMMSDLGVLQGFSDSYATRINNKGEVVGYSSKTDEFGNPVARACLWGSTGIIEMKTMAPAEDPQSIDYGVANGVNDSTVAVGMQFVGFEPRAFIWDADNGMRDLNSLIPEGSNWLLAAATAINNKGEIVGYGYINGSENASAFLLIPPPKEEEPTGPLQVAIDIRPWNSHNTIHKQSWWGMVPVAILSSPDFNAVKDVDRKSLTFGPRGEETHAAFCTPGGRDANRDRSKDLICYFHERPAKFQCGNIRGTIKGKTKKGIDFQGEDTVQVVPCPLPKKHPKGR